MRQFTLFFYIKSCGTFKLFPGKVIFYATTCQSIALNNIFPLWRIIKLFSFIERMNIKAFLIALYALLLQCSCIYAQRLNAIVPVPPNIPFQISLDRDVTSGPAMLVFQDSGDSAAIQHMTGDRWVFISGDTLQPGESFKIIPLASEDGVSLKNTEDSLLVLIENRPVFVYSKVTRQPPPGSPSYYQRSGFIHPAYTPAGQILTDGFPEGHMHQHGIFSAWVQTLYKGKDTDFWNQQDRTGTVRFDSLISFRDGPVFGELVTRQKHLALTETDTVEVLEEDWTIRIYRITEFFVWDISLLQRNISDAELGLLPYHYGGMAFRGSSEWNDTTLTEDAERTGPGKGGFLTSLGNTRLDGNHSRPDWTTMYGNINGRLGSLTVIQHQNNPNYPQFVRIHPRMPYFCYFPNMERGMALKPGDTYSSSYRIITSGNVPDPALFDLLTVYFRQFRLK